MELKENGLGLEEFKHRVWAVTVPAGYKYDDLFNKDNWKHICSRFTQGDTIRIRYADHTVFAELYVVACDRTWAQVKELRRISFSDEETVSGGGYEIKWGSPKVQYGVYRVSDGERIKDGFQTKELATEWLDEHLKATAA